MEQLLLVTWKSMLIFVILVVLSRSIGRKLLSQMSYFDFTVGITIGSISGSYVVQMIEGMWVLIAPVLLTLLAISFDFLNLKNLRFRKLADGEPVVVIRNGQILDKNMKKVRYHLDNLESQLRDKGIFDLGEVEFAVLEPHGILSVLKKSQHLPLTPKDMNTGTAYKGMPTPIIKDGQLFEHNLVRNNLSLEWLDSELKKRQVNRISDIFYAAVDTDHGLFLSVKENSLIYTPSKN
ncbi:DUF421 domain-containing protein [Dehalobacter sp. DCM]|uniref:YetF domain-containing protein n=1 Tax=Dehalobacter sp. DCM TaxID=2907827 RepID=UPI0030815486|nr:DUF421 domain-containing protein [Dehalobacter sp. DCM]